MEPISSVPQRFIRPFKAPPGYWKKQLPTKYLALAAHGDIPALERLLAEHPEFLNKRGPFNRTLLWEAVRRGRLETVCWLLERGAEVDATGCYNNESMIQLTPYCAALYYHRPELAELLLAQGAQVDIFRAAFLGYQAQVLADLDADPSLLNAEDPYDATYYAPLITFAVKGGHYELVNALIAHGAQLAPYSAMLIGIAAGDSRLDLLELLIAHGARLDQVDAGIFVGVTDPHLFRWLLAHGVSLDRPGLGGFPPLIYMARGDKGQSPEKIKFLLEYGAPVNAIGPQGRTALHYAAAAGNPEILSLLLAHGADPSLRDERGNTPRDLALAKGKQAAADLLAAHPGA